MEELIKRALEQNQEAYARLFELTHNNVAFAIRILLNDEIVVDDLLQETYITAFQKLDTLKEHDKFNAWICKIARNKAIDYLRKNKEVVFKKLPIENDEGTSEVIDLPEDRVEFIPEKQMDQNETTRLLMSILNELPPEQKVCIIAFYYEQQSIKEIANELGCSEETVKSRIRYAKRKIKEQVELLEKNGTHLYGIAPIPFFVWLLKNVGETYQYSGTLTGEQIATSSMESTMSTPNASSITQGAGKVMGSGGKLGSLGAKVKALTIGQKIVIGIASVGVTAAAVGGGVSVYQYFVQADNQAVVSQVEDETEEKTEVIDIDENIVEYVSLLDQIDRLTPTNEVELLKQFCEINRYETESVFTIKLHDGTESDSVCDAFGFIGTILADRGVISRDSYYPKEAWWDEDGFDRFGEKIKEGGYRKSNKLEDVNVGSILVRESAGSPEILYVNNIQEDIYEVLYWEPEMIREEDFSMDSLFKTPDEMQRMISNDYILFAYDENNLNGSEIDYLEGRGSWNIEYVTGNAVVINIEDCEYGVWAVEYSTEKEFEEYKFIDEMRLRDKIFKESYTDFSEEGKKEIFRGKILLDGLEEDTTYYMKLYLTDALTGQNIKAIETKAIVIHTQPKMMTLEKGIYSCYCQPYETTQIVQGFGHECAGVKEGMLLGNVLALYGSVAKYDPETWECSDYSEMKSHYYLVSDDVKLWFEYHDPWSDGEYEVDRKEFNLKFKNGSEQLVITSDGERIIELRIIWMP